MIHDVRRRAMSSPQMLALAALTRAGALLCYTIHGAVVIDGRKRRTKVATETARSLARYGWVASIVDPRGTFRITDAGRYALAAAKRRARG